MAEDQKEDSIIEWFESQVVLAEERLLANTDLKLGQVKMWIGSIRGRVVRIFGGDQPAAQVWLPKNIPDGVNPHEELARRVQDVKKMIDSLKKIEAETLSSKVAKVFIGHGQSPLWRELKDFLADRLGLAWDEFNRESVAGFLTFERLSEMLDSASFAFMIMTAEDLHDDDTVHARQNVVHEVGLFQGCLGPRKAIILLEEECSEFTNIVGLSQIRFPKGNIGAVFEDVRRVLEREGICET